MQNSTKLFFTAWFSSQKCTLSYNISGGGETRPKEPKFEEKSILKKVLIFDLIQHMAEWLDLRPKYLGPQNIVRKFAKMYIWNEKKIVDQ